MLDTVFSVKRRGASSAAQLFRQVVIVCIVCTLWALSADARPYLTKPVVSRGGGGSTWKPLADGDQGFMGYANYSGCGPISTTFPGRLSSAGGHGVKYFAFVVRNTFYLPINVTGVNLYADGVECLSCVTLYWALNYLDAQTRLNDIPSFQASSGWNLKNYSADLGMAPADMSITLSGADATDGSDTALIVVESSEKFLVGTPRSAQQVYSDTTPSESGLLLISTGAELLSSGGVPPIFSVTGTAWDVAAGVTYCTLLGPMRGCANADQLSGDQLSDASALVFAVQNYAGVDVQITDVYLTVVAGSEPTLSALYVSNGDYNATGDESGAVNPVLWTQLSVTPRYNATYNQLQLHFFPALKLGRDPAHRTLSFYVRGLFGVAANYFDYETSGLTGVVDDAQAAAFSRGLTMRPGLELQGQTVPFGASTTRLHRALRGRISFCVQDGTCGQPCAGFNRIENPLPPDVAGWGSCTNLVACGVPCNCQCYPGFDLDGRPWICRPDSVGQGMSIVGQTQQGCAVGKCPLGQQGRGLNCTVNPEVDPQTPVTVKFVLLYGFNQEITAEDAFSEAFKAELVDDIAVALAAPRPVFQRLNTYAGDDGIYVKMELDVLKLANTDNRTAIDLANELKQQVNSPRSILYAGILTRYLDPSSFIAELIGLIAGLSMYYVIGVCGGLFVVFTLVYCVHRRAHPDAESILFVAVLWSLVVCASNINFVIFLGTNVNEFPEFTNHYYASIAFLAGPFVINFFLAVYFVRNELKTNEDFKQYAHQFPCWLSLFVLLGGIKTSNLRISLSKVMGWRPLEFPWSTESDLLLKSLGLIGSLLADAPLGAIMLIILQTQRGSSDRVLFSFCAICVSVLLVIATRMWSTVKYVKHRKATKLASMELNHSETNRSTDEDGDSGSPSTPPVTSKPKKSSSAAGAASNGRSLERDSDVLAIGDRHSIPAFPAAERD